MPCNIPFSQSIRVNCHWTHYLRKNNVISLHLKNMWMESNSNLILFILHLQEFSYKFGMKKVYFVLLSDLFDAKSVNKQSIGKAITHKDFEFLSYPLLDLWSWWRFRDKSQFRVVLFLPTMNVGHQNLYIITSQDQIPRKYSTVSSRTRFIRASYPFNIPVTIPLNKYNSQPTLTSTLEFDSNSLILILLKIKNELLLSLQINSKEKEITMREEWSWRVCYLLQLVEDRETW